MLATTGEHGEPIAVPCSCLKNLSWKVKTQFSKTNFRSCITSSFSRPMVLHLKEHPYLSLASGSLMCSVNSLLMMSKAVGTGMLVNRAEMSKETNSSSPLIFTNLRWSLKLCCLWQRMGLSLCTFGGFWLGIWLTGRLPSHKLRL